MAALRVLLRLAAVLLIAGVVYLVIMKPKANVLSAALGTKVTLSVQCSSVVDQWRHHAQPAVLDLNSVPVAQVGPAQKDCDSASRTIKQVGGAMVGGAAVAFGMSFFFRRRP
jgi:non-ribosomal peptide synthetase component E (peptide arylation enzyme)